MFRFLRARAGLMLFTTRRLLTLVRWHVPRIMRDSRKLEEQKEALEHDEQSGDVDKLLRDFDEQTKKSAELMKRLMAEERHVFVAEFRNAKDFEEAEQDLEKFEEAVTRKQASLKNDEAAQRFHEHLEEFKKRVREIEESMKEAFAEEYHAVLRQEKGQRGELQGRIYTVNDIMATMNKAWEQRKTERQEYAAEKALKKDEQRLLHDLERADAKHFANHEEHFRQETNHFLLLYEQTWKAYRLMLLAFTQIFFYLRSNEEYYAKLEARLRKEGFPKLEALAEDLRRMHEKEQVDIQTVTHIFRRGGRLTT